MVRARADQQLRRRRERGALRTFQLRLRRRSRKADDGLLAARLSPRSREKAVGAGATDDDLLRTLVRAVSVVQGRLQAGGGAAPRNGAPERGRVRQQVPQRL